MPVHVGVACPVPINTMPNNNRLGEWIVDEEMATSVLASVIVCKEVHTEKHEK